MRCRFVRDVWHPLLFHIDLSITENREQLAHNPPINRKLHSIVVPTEKADVFVVQNQSE